jgi:Fe-S oxidoreductase
MLFGIDRRRTVPAFRRHTLRQRLPPTVHGHADTADALLFVDTFTNHYDPEIGRAALNVLNAAGVRTALAPNGCCGRSQISKGLLDEARTLAGRNADLLYDAARAGRPIVFCEPSCLSAVREDAPDLLRGEARQKAQAVARVSVLFEEFMAPRAGTLPLRKGPGSILLHGHCHQRSMALVAASRQLLSTIPGAAVTDLEAGCCGMAGSFGYEQRHYEVSRAIAERKLVPAIRGRSADSVVVAAGTSCRHQIHDFADSPALHPAVLLDSLLGDERAHS